MSARGKYSVFILGALLACFASRSGYAKAPQGRYVIANGEVTDTKTGLVWQQTLNPNAYTFAEAVAECPKLGGFWRTPNVKELASLVDESNSFPAIDEDAFPGTPAAEQWSSTPDASDSAYAFVVDFSDGGVAVAPVATKNRLRCVR